MKHFTALKKNLRFIILKKLLLASIIVGFMAAFLAIALKRITEYYETIFFLKAEGNWIYLLVFPIFGLSIIYFLRQYLFKKKENKGIREIFESTDSKTKNLPSYKIPSHFINGLLTVAFGGSTGIEVSTVVASATIGSVAQQKVSILKRYKTELICAGVAAGITALFSSPIAGILFVIEVITKKRNKTLFFTTIIGVVMAMVLIFVLDEEPLFAISIQNWHLDAIPYFMLLGVLAGMHAVYLTKSVIFIKSAFMNLNTPYSRIILGSALLSLLLILLPQLYGDGYHAIKELFFQTPEIAMTLPLALTLLCILALKPVITAVTLASGGDGGVFAPSLFLGAFLGFFVALFVNTFFNANVIPVNFMILGMAAMLSASIHAPFTALFLVCGVTNDYTLFFPILTVCVIAKYTSKVICPYTVYTLSRN